jgi:F0F1-type ATP synthase alpha subunit
MGKKTMQTTLNPSEISELIKKRVEELDISAETRNEGTVVSVSDGIARIHGLEDAMQGEMIAFPGNTFGLALNLERDSVGSVILGDYEHITEGDTVKCTGRILEVPQGRGLLGRVVDALGNPIDGQGPIDNDGFAPIEKVAPGVIWLPSARSSPRWPTWSPSSKSTAPWSTPSWSTPRLPSRPPCSTSRRTPAAPWANTSATAAKTP